MRFALQTMNQTPAKTRQDQAPGQLCTIRLFINFSQILCRWITIYLHSKVQPTQSPTIRAWGWMSAIDYMKLRDDFSIRDQYEVYNHISVNAIARYHKLFKCQPWFTTEEWRPYLCAITAIRSSTTYPLATSSYSLCHMPPVDIHLTLGLI